MHKYWFTMTQRRRICLRRYSRSAWAIAWWRPPMWSSFPETLLVVSCDQPHALNAALGELAEKVEGILAISVLRVVNRY